MFFDTGNPPDLENEHGREDWRYDSISDSAGTAEARQVSEGSLSAASLSAPLVGALVGAAMRKVAKNRLYANWEAKDIIRMLEGELAKKNPGPLFIRAGIDELSRRNLRKNRQKLRELRRQAEEALADKG